MLKYTDYNIVFQEIPDEVTLALNISGCPNRCRGCHSPWLWENVGRVLTSKELERLLRKYGDGVTCVCFMGGDAEPEEVERLAREVRSLGTGEGGVCADGLKGGIELKEIRTRWKTAWYSGRQALPKGISAASFDYIKLGPYIQELGPLPSHITNQRLYKVLQNDEMMDITEYFWK